MFLGQSSCDILLSVDVRHPLNFHILIFSPDTTFLNYFKLQQGSSIGNPNFELYQIGQNHIQDGYQYKK
jgi:hypothetical protein